MKGFETGLQCQWSVKQKFGIQKVDKSEIAMSKKNLLMTKLTFRALVLVDSPVSCDKKG